MAHIETDSAHCSGCSACVAACLKDAISLIADKEGFMTPMVDAAKCTECGICIRTCPVNADKELDAKETRAFAVQYKDDAVRKKSASGAFFPAVAKFFLEEKKGYVCGCILGEDLLPKHIVSNDWQAIQKMQDSKYVQSNMGNCYVEIAALLKDGQWVLFTGTSCQVNGLKSVLCTKKINAEHLLCIDFFCHGVPSPRIWKEYLSFYEKQKHRKIVGYRFRCKKYGWGKNSMGSNYLNSVNLGDSPLVKLPNKNSASQNGETTSKWDDFSYEARMWREIFFSNLCIRTYCHSCPYTTVQKPADITMGDFWGIENVAPEFDDGKGCSIVLLRTPIAKELFHQLKIHCKQVELADAIKKQANAFYPSPVGTQRESFWKDYSAYGFDYVAKKYFGYTPKERAKSFVKRILFELKLRNLY